MACFIILTDKNVQSLLRSSSQAEILRFANILSQTLHQYSTTDEAEYQPHRAVIKRPTGQLSLFMPSTSATTIGVKTVGIPPPSASSATTTNNNNNNNNQDTSGRSGTCSKPPTLEATLTLCDAAGKAIGVLNAGELTAFRTSLGAMLLFGQRRNVTNLVIFGSGKQAYWHLRLALLLRGTDIKSITVVNRSLPRAEELLQSLQNEVADVRTEILTPQDTDYSTKLETKVRSANTIHCTVPSTEPLFPASWIFSSTSPTQTPYISAIGSYRLDMRELDPELLRKIIATDPSSNPGPQLYVPQGRATPVIVVDSRSGCFQEAGEIVAAEYKAEHVLEIGELYDRGWRPELQGGEDFGERKSAGFNRWLEDGLLVYKSVGIGVMDICIGAALLELAREKGVGIHVDDF